MPDIDDLRDRLRQELHDEDSGSYRWTDAVLDRHLARAASDLSFVWPDEQKTTLTTTAGSRDLSLSSLTGLVRIEAVEYPAGQYPPIYVRFSTFAGVLTLLVNAAPAAVEDVSVYWDRLY